MIYEQDLENIPSVRVCMCVIKIHTFKRFGSFFRIILKRKKNKRINTENGNRIQRKNKINKYDDLLIQIDNFLLYCQTLNLPGMCFVRICSVLPFLYQIALVL